MWRRAPAVVAWLAVACQGALICAQEIGPSASRAAGSRAPALDEGRFVEVFEGAEPSWQPAGSDGAVRELARKRLRLGGRQGPGCEQIQIAAQNNTYVYYAHPTPPARLIDELRGSLWVLADREGVQLFARVVLPRTRDPQSGAPRTTLLRGTAVARVGSWEQLRVAQLPEQLAQQAPALRAELGPALDMAEAYVDALFLNVYGGPGTTTVWIDGLELDGAVGFAAGGQAALSSHAGGLPPEVSVVAARPRVELQGSVLRVDGRAWAPRLIEYRGEPLAWLRERGFNGIWSREPLAATTLAEAAQIGLGVVCPPPEGLADIERGYGPVVAWYVGSHLAHAQFDATRDYVAAIRRADRQGRPIVGEVESDLRLYSRYIDVLLLHREPLGTTLELPDYAQWLRHRPALARPGTPAWTVVQTQYDAGVLGQLRLLDPAADPPPAPEPEQIRLVALSAVGAGAHGFLFRSDARLDADDRASRGRAQVLELLNFELAVLEPWLTGGQVAANVTGNPPQVSAALVQLDRARMLVPVWAGRGAQFVPGQSAGRELSFVVPGVPEPHKAFEATPAGLVPLASTRVTGGKRLLLGEFGLASAIVFAQDQDPHVLAGLSLKLKQNNARVAGLARDLAAVKLTEVQAVVRQLDETAQREAIDSGWLQAAQTALDEANARLEAGNAAAAYLAADRALRPLRMLQRAEWTSVVAAAGSPVATPAGTSFSTLPAHARLWRQLAAASIGPNRLIGGDLEDLAVCQRAGWRHVQNPRAELAFDVGLAAEAPHGGRRALRLRCEPRRAESAPTLLDAPIAWIETAPVQAAPGSWVRIRGYVRVPRPIAASVDGLMIIDNCGGAALAERVIKTDGWREFTLYRAAPASGTVVVTFALAGLGEAWVDDVTIEPVTLGPVETPPVAAVRGVRRGGAWTRREEFAPPPVPALRR